MKINVVITGQVMCYNGSMHIQIFEQDRLIYDGKNLSEGPLTIELDLSWPTTLNVVLSNKQENDTLIDDCGNVIKDKAIEITGLCINHFPIHSKLLDKLFECKKDNHDQITNENWWGFNGSVKISFDQNNPMRYLLNLKNEFDLNRLDWNQDE